MRGAGRHALAALAVATGLATGLVGCAAPAGPAASLVGVWCNTMDDGASCWAYDSFDADGRFEACGRTDDDPRPFRGRGVYAVEGRRMCYQVTEATPNFWLGPGARYCTEIVAIDAASHRYRDLDTQAEFRLLRVPAASKRCPS